jgi:hypothetical protein
MILLTLAGVAILSRPPTVMAGETVMLRINTSHALNNAKGAVIDAGLRLAKDVSVVATSPTNSPFIPPDKFIEDAKAHEATILSSSFSHWNSYFDSALYLGLTRNGMVHVFAYEPRQPQPRNAPPPAAFVTVNVVGGRTGDGIEFGVPPRYMNGIGGGTTPSDVTAQLAGLMACLKYLHPAWNWFDVKAALRATATNFATGYDPRKSGYGAINYFAANALSDAAALPLYPPAAVSRSPRSDQIDFAINSFKQSRRVADVLFKFAAPPPPHPKELTLSEIIALGGRMVFAGDRSATTNTVSYKALHDEMICFVWFTRDASGTFSRIEPYSVIGPVLLLAKPPEPGPRMKPPIDFLVR